MALKEVKYARTTQEQIFFYKEYCKTHPEVQGGYKGQIPQEVVQQSWKKLAEVLNALNGPVRTPVKWKETLTHWKNQINSRARKESAYGNARFLKDKYDRLMRSQQMVKNFTSIRNLESEVAGEKERTCNLNKFIITRGSECQELEEKEIFGLTSIDNEEETLMDILEGFSEPEVTTNIEANDTVTDEIEIKEEIIQSPESSSNLSLEEIKVKWTEAKLKEEIQMMRAEHQLKMKILKEKHELECKIAWEKHEMEKRLLFCRRDKSS